MVKCGARHSLILLENGNLYSCGDNEYGQLGLNDTKNRNTFHKISLDKKIIQVSACDYHTLVLTEDLQIYSCGYNFYGQLGLGDTRFRNVFEWIKTLKEKKIIQIECGITHSCALTDDGFIYSWGDNEFGQLGHGDTENKYIPTLINGLNKIKRIYCGGYYTMAINESDEVYVWGWNGSGELGLGDTKNRFKPEIHPFFKNKKIKRIACGHGHCLVIFENGEIFSWGYNDKSQLGHGDTNERNTPTSISFFKGMNVKDVFAYYSLSFVILENYDIYAFGCNEYGQLALNDIENRGTPEKITFFLNEKIVGIESGFCHTLFITEDGKIYGVGSSSVGQVGIGTASAALVPKLVSFTKNE